MLRNASCNAELLRFNSCGEMAGNVKRLGKIGALGDKAPG
jgi:hypothetical protein